MNKEIKALAKKELNVWLHPIVRIKALNRQNNFKECETMFVCRKCGKEVQEEEISREYLLENRRGKASSDKMCSECN